MSEAAGMENVIKLATLRLPAGCIERADQIFGQTPRIYTMTDKQEKMFNELFDKLCVEASLPGANIGLLKENCQAQAHLAFIKFVKASRKALHDNPDGQTTSTCSQFTIAPAGKLKGFSNNNQRRRLLAGELASAMHKVDKELESNRFCLEDPINYHALSIELWDCFYSICNWYSVAAFGKGTLECELEKSEEGKSYLEFWHKSGSSGFPGEEILDSTLKESFAGQRCDAVNHEFLSIWELDCWQDALPPRKIKARYRKENGESHIKALWGGVTVMDTQSCRNPYNCIVVDLNNKTLELVPIQAVLLTTLTWNREDHAHLIVAYLKHVAASFMTGEAVFSPVSWYSVVCCPDSIPQALPLVPSEGKGPKKQVSIYDGPDNIYYHTETTDRRVWKYRRQTRSKIASYFNHLSDVFVSQKGALPTPLEWESVDPDFN